MPMYNIKSHTKKRLADTTTPVSIYPVSYTHLDVYKRQYQYSEKDEYAVFHKAQSG